MNNQGYNKVRKHVRRQMGMLLGMPLTQCEIDTIVSIMQGNTTRHDLARACGTSVGGMGVRISNIYAKTGAVTIADIVLMAIGCKRGALDLTQCLRDTGTYEIRNADLNVIVDGTKART